MRGASTLKSGTSNDVCSRSINFQYHCAYFDQGGDLFFQHLYILMNVSELTTAWSSLTCAAKRTTAAPGTQHRWLMHIPISGHSTLERFLN